jgi:hypothetical protein
MTQDNDTITLKDAAGHFGYTVSTLRAEAGRGRLVIYKIGKRLYTTPADIKKLQISYRAIPMPLECLASELVAPAGIYIVGFSNFIKIGWSSFIEKRIEEIQCGVPEKLTIHRCLEGTMRHERYLHHRFSKQRLRGEWFRLEGELAEWIKNRCWP